MDPSQPGSALDELCLCKCHAGGARPLGVDTTAIHGAENWRKAPCVDCCTRFFNSREENANCTEAFEEFEERQVNERTEYNQTRMRHCILIKMAEIENQERSRTWKEFVTTYEERVLPLMETILTRSAVGGYSVTTRRVKDNRRAICITTTDKLSEEVKLSLQRAKDATFSETLRSSIDLEYFTGGIEFTKDDGRAESNA